MFKTRLKSLLGRIIFLLRAHRLLLRRQAVVVAFHSVNDYSIASDINCTPQLFEQYCRFFRRYFNVIPLSELLEKLEGGTDVAGDLVITFDDGYKDNFAIAAPILSALHLPATFFVTTGFIESTDSAPWDAELSINSEWMTWGEVVELSQMGFDIGGHTVSHPSLANIADDAAAREIENCKTLLESKLNLQVPHFAYPFGGRDNISEKRVGQVIEADFQCCMSCYGGTVTTGESLFWLRRAPITTRHITPYDFAFDCVRQAA